jgi:hypothetical protein
MDKIQYIGKATEAISHINDKLIDSLMIELNLLRDKVNKGSNLSDVSSKLLLINKKLEELKNSYESTSITNQQNKRLILNQIDDISNSFFYHNLDPKTGEDNLYPKIGEDNLEKIKFVELVNPEPILQQTGIFIKNIEDDLEKLVRLINSHIELDKKKLVEYESHINNKMNDLGNINKKINKTIGEIDRINNTYTDYIKQYDKIDFDLNNSYFFPNECLNESNPEMVAYSRISVTSDEELNVDAEFQLLKESIQSINILNPIDKTTTIAKLMTDPNTLDKLLIGGSTEAVQRTPSYAVQSHENYYQHVLEYSIKLEELQRNFSYFKNKCRSFNIKYIRMYNHVLFIVNYLKLTVLDQNKDYQIYNYIGLNTIIYYKEIVDKIIESINKKTTLGKYFNKYHYINIQILKKFFNFIKMNWKEYGKYCDTYTQDKYVVTRKIKIATSKLHLYNDKLLDNQSIKKSIFIFNAMKDLLDKFKSLSSPPVAVYLRINHNPTIGDLDESKKVFVKDSSKVGYISNESLSKCTLQSQRRQENIGNVKFAEVFDSETFNDNSVLSKYMSIPTFLSQGKSIMLLTYGYSGVGKTFTVFGTHSTPGMLQTAIGNIQHQHGIYFRAYELYGLAFPYKSYWDRKPEDYHQFIYDYTINQKMPSEINSSSIKGFVNQIDRDPITTGTSFKELTHDKLLNFQEIIDNIDSTRELQGRIKTTKNNIKSSRSIMIFDFKIKIKETGDYVEDYVNFVIIDLPGKENIKETFVEGDICIPLKDSLSSFTRNMAFLSPLSLMLNKTIANQIFTEFDYLSQDENFSITYLGDDYKKNNSEYINKLQKIKDQGNSNSNSNYGLEIMRNIINNNKFDLLSNFYEKYLFNKPTIDGCYKKDKYSLAPFEGYYINENIIGLLSSLLKNLCLNNRVIEVQDEIFSNTAKKHPEFISYANRKGNKGSYINSIDNEVKAQTYFFRFLLKNSDINLKTNFCGHTIEDWINDSYDYNKIFNVDNPPIEGLLEPYFKYIKNFYVFYVVSNDDPEKCDKQIKLIADSKVFLDELNRYNEDNNKKTPEGNCTNK